MNRWIADEKELAELHRIAQKRGVTLDYDEKTGQMTLSSTGLDPSGNKLSHSHVYNPPNFLQAKLDIERF